MTGPLNKLPTPEVTWRGGGGGATWRGGGGGGGVGM